MQTGYLGESSLVGAIKLSTNATFDTELVITKNLEKFETISSDIRSMNHPINSSEC